MKAGLFSLAMLFSVSAWGFQYQSPDRPLVEGCIDLHNSYRQMKRAGSSFINEKIQAQYSSNKGDYEDAAKFHYMKWMRFGNQCAEHSHTHTREYNARHLGKKGRALKVPGVLNERCIAAFPYW